MIPLSVRDSMGAARPCRVWVCCIEGCETAVRFLLGEDNPKVRPEFRGRAVCFMHAPRAYMPEVVAESMRRSAAERAALARRSPPRAKVGKRAQREAAYLEWLGSLSELGPARSLAQLVAPYIGSRTIGERVIRRRVAALRELLTSGESTLLHFKLDDRRTDAKWLDRHGWIVSERKPDARMVRRYHYRLTPKGVAFAETLVAQAGEVAA